MLKFTRKIQHGTSYGWFLPNWTWVLANHLKSDLTGFTTAAARTTIIQGVHMLCVIPTSTPVKTGPTQNRAIRIAYLNKKAGRLDKLLVFGVGVGVMHYKGFWVHCKAEAHADHIVYMQDFVLQVPCEALVVPGHQVLRNQYIRLIALHSKRTSCCQSQPSDTAHCHNSEYVAV